MIKLSRCSFCLLFVTSFLPSHGVVDFEKQVWPILENRCIECHKAPYEQAGRVKNPKAGLRLDGAAHIMLGSDDGPVIKVDHPSQSSLYIRVTLPYEDDEHMPPKGEPLSDKQKEILRKWIAQGVDFGAWVGATDGVDEVKKERAKEKYVPAHIIFYNNLGNGLSPISETLIQKISKETGLLIRPIGVGHHLLEARRVSTGIEVNEDTIIALNPLREHLAKLDLYGAELTDKSLSEIGLFQRLTHLNLRKSSIEDSGLKKISGLSNLLTLNLSETNITDYGIHPLLEIKSLQNLHLWETGISDARLKFLKNRLREAKITP